MGFQMNVPRIDAVGKPADLPGAVNDAPAPDGWIGSGRGKLSQSRTTGASPDSAATRLNELLGYVEQVVKLDEHPAFKLAEYRLANGQTYQFHQHEFHALPGVKHDQEDDDGPIWLTMERLKRRNPPVPSETLRVWLDLSPDPERTPVLRDFLLGTVSGPERDALVADGKVRPEDCQPAFGPEGEGKFDIRYRLEDYPEVSTEADRYLTAEWLSWANEERPRRRSIALYQKLFEAAQFVELGGPEQGIELVWGIGLSRWVKDGALIDLPLLERLVEIEIDGRAAGRIRVRPRLADATINLRPYEELKLDGAALALNAARRALAISAEDGEGVSPFLRETFEPILRACQSQIDAEGRYLPDSDAFDPSEGIPPASAQLAVRIGGSSLPANIMTTFSLRISRTFRSRCRSPRTNCPDLARLWSWVRSVKAISHGSLYRERWADR
jgi:hypothetical protein